MWMAVIQVSGGRIYFSDHGEGPLVVLAHGMGGNHAVWYKQIAALAKSYRVVAYDHRGFGLSRDDSGEGRSAYARDLLALLDHVGADKSVLVGQSMGGGTCISFSGLHPDRVAALVVASSLHALVESAEIKTIMDRARAETQELPQLERVLGADFRIECPAESLLYAEISSFNQTTRETLKGAWPLMQTPEQIGALGMPIVFMAGGQDRLFPVEAMRLTQARVAASHLVEFDAAGHSAYFERPLEFNDSLLRFLQMCNIGGRAPTAHSNLSGYGP